MPLLRHKQLERRPWHKRLSKDRARRVRQLCGQISAPPKEGSQRDLENRLERLNACCLKMEHSYQCSQCAADGIPNQGILDAGHIYPKGKYPGGKFLYENLIPQCRFHNELHISKPEILFTFYQDKLGEDALIKLHERVLSMPRRMSVEWLESEIEKREIQIAELECHISAMV